MTPKFAVVGHPNKGKSTIVAALAMDDSVAISDRPGTTTKAKEYPLKVDNKTIYTLIDTPGFQRPRSILAELKKTPIPAHKRLEKLKEFVDKNIDNKRYSDDIELLRPIVEGAGIIYVVDASKPYSVEFELDMQILSFAGAPSMAILNFIDQSDYSKEWQEALKHYFKITKRFNPMRADIKEYIDLLSAIGHLNYEWSDSIKESIELFKMLYNQRVQRSAIVISDYIFSAMSYTKSMPLKDNKDDLKEQLEIAFKEDLIKKEQHVNRKIKDIWDHKRAKIELESFKFNDLELFSKQSEEYFGLNQKELIGYSATLGGAIGAGIDGLFLGHTVFLGATIGAISGAVAGYLGFEKLADFKIMGIGFGKKELQIGPIKNINFAFILLGRALNFTKVLATLSYAKKGDIELKTLTDILKEKEKKELFKLHKKIIDAKKLSELKKEYQELIFKILQREITN